MCRGFSVLSFSVSYFNHARQTFYFCSSFFYPTQKQDSSKPFPVQSVTGYFILQGDTTCPFTYRIEAIRDGGGYCQRQVFVTQDSNKGVCFTCICSFKRPERSFNERSLNVDLREKYKVVLDGKEPGDWPECPGIDSPLYVDSSFSSFLPSQPYFPSSRSPPSSHLIFLPCILHNAR